jgi:hypothetical protein
MSQFNFYALPHVTHIVPMFGSAEGGTVVTVHGRAFPNSDQLKCRFSNENSNVSVAARWISSTRLECVVIGSTASRADISVFVGSAGNTAAVSSTDAGVYFRYLGSDVVLGVHPLVSPVSGGVDVTIELSRDTVALAAAKGALCSFGSTSVAASVRTPSTILCRTPPHNRTNVNFRLHLGNSTMKVLVHASFAFVDPPTVRLVSPTEADRAGGTLVSATLTTTSGLRTINTTLASGFSCTYGSVRTTATLKSSTEITCLSPAWPGVSSVAAFSMWWGNSELVTSSYTFHFLRNAKVLSINPKQGFSFGGTIVTIIVSGVDSATDEQLFCAFGKTNIGARHVSGSTFECLSPSHSPGDVKLQMLIVARNMNVVHRIIGVETTFRYALNPVIASLSPTSGSSEGGTVVYIYGNYFPNDVQLRCYFGEMHSRRAEYLNSTVIRCVTGAHGAAAPATVPLSLGFGDVHNPSPLLVASTLNFKFVPSLVITSMIPDFGPPRGGTAVTLSIVHAVQQKREKSQNYVTTAFCRFGHHGIVSAIVDRRNESFTAVTCACPPQSLEEDALGTNRFHVELAYTTADNGTGRHTCMSPHEFAYRDFPTLLRISPQQGDVTGGTAIHVHGVGFFKSRYATCTFGAVLSAHAYWVSSTLVICEAPAATEAGRVTFKYNADGNGMSDTYGLAPTFNYLPSPVVLSANPTSGPAQGGAIVEIQGANFARDDIKFQCAFGAHRANAVVLSNSKVKCRSPAAVDANGMVVKVGLLDESGNRVLGLKQNQTFSYTSMAVIQYVSPVVIPVNRRSLLSLVGANLFQLLEHGDDIHCRFANQSSFDQRAIVVSNASVTCVAPKLPLGKMSVQLVAAESKRYVELSTVAEVNVVQTPQLISLTPVSGPFRGGTKVHILANNIPRVKGHLTCRFGTASAIALRVSESLLVCETPAKSTLNNEETVHVSLGLPSLDILYGGLEFTYTPNVVLHSIWPTWGSTLGGTPVTLRGSFFEASRDLVCRFGINKANASFINRTALRCIAPPSAAAAEVDVTVTTNGVDFSSQVLKYLYMESALVTDLHPRSGSTVGGSTISISGTNFLLGPATCYFGNRGIPGTAVSMTTILCKSPPSVLNATMAVLVTVIQSNQLAMGSARFQYTHAPNIHRVNMKRGLVAGNGAGLLATIVGGPFVNSPHLSCKFDTVVSAAQWISASEIKCRAIQNATGVVTVSASNDGIDFGSSSQTSITYFGTLSIVSIHPTSGPMSGNSTVTIRGTQFLLTTAISCRFGVVTVSGTFVNSTTMICITPAAELGRVDVDVSLNGVDFTSSGKSYRYTYDRDLSTTSGVSRKVTSNVTLLSSTTPPEIVAITPAFGNTNGGTVTIVTGTLFEASATLRCRFGFNDSKASFINRTAVRCVTPPSFVVGSVKVSISSDGIEYSASQGNEVRYLYTTSAIVKTIVPSFGSPEGSTLLTIAGENFAVGEAITCSFGELRAACEAVSTTRIMCRSPASKQTGPVSVTVSKRHEQESLLGSSMFTYAWPPHVTRIEPSHGSARGQSGTVITGSGFQNSPTLVCFFGSTSSAAQWLSPTSVRCVTPPSNGPSLVTVGVSNNGINHYATSNATYRFVPACAVLSVTPRSGSTSGNMSIKITGKNFIFSTALRCRFGTVVVTASYVNRSTITCRTPPHRNISVAIEVSTNGFDYTSNEVQFRYNPDIELLKLTPTFGSIAGGTLVNISGVNFMRSSNMRCRFGNNGVVSAQYITSTLIACRAPPASDARTVEVAVSQHSSDVYTPLGLTFTFNEEERVKDVGQCLSWITSADSKTSYEFHGMMDQLSHQRQYLQSSAAMVSLVPVRGPVSGHTVVMIRGHSFSQGARLHCYFGLNHSSVLASYINSTAIVCTTSTVRHAGSVSVALSAEAVASSIHHFTFYVEPQVIHVDPLHGWGGDRVQVTLDSPVQKTTKVWCRFGETILLAQHSVGDVVSCLVPIHATSQCESFTCTKNRFLIELSFNRHNWISNDIWFTSHAEPILKSVRPTAAWKGDSLRIIGSGFSIAVPTVCYFIESGMSPTKGIAVPTRWLNSEIVTCVVPEIEVTARRPTEVRIEIHTAQWSPASSSSSWGGDATANVTKFVYFSLLDEPTALTLKPKSGSDLASTVVSVEVRNFDLMMPVIGTLNWLCWFGSTSTPGTVLSRTMLSCVAPPGIFTNANATFVPFSLSNGVGTSRFAGGLFHRSTDSAVAMTSLSPQSGSLRGGTLIHVYGKYPSTADEGVICRFVSVTFASADALVVAGWRVSAAEVQCLSPAVTTAQLTRISVSVDGGSSFNSPSSSLLFKFQHLARISSLVPSMVKSHEATVISVSGHNFLDSAELQCLFNQSIYVKAKWVNQTLILCNCPGIFDYYRQRSIEIAVSNNGVDFSQSVNRTLEVVPVISIQNVTSHNIVSGGGRTLNIVLQQPLSMTSSINDASRLLCRFGEIITTASRVPTQLKSLRCATPAVNAEIGTDLAVEVSIDGGIYFSPPRTVLNVVSTGIKVRKQFPLSGSWNGGTQVEFVLSQTPNFVIGEIVFCRFGDASPTIAVMTAEERVIRCTSPAASAAVNAPSSLSVPVAISISGGSGAFSVLSGVQFTYHISASTFSVVPDAGLAEGGTSVVVRGANFVQNVNLSCAFQFSATQNGTTVGLVFAQATWLSRTKARCVTPALPMMGSFLSARVSISNNGQDVVRDDNNPLFRYRSHIAIHSVEPAWSPTYGADIAVNIIGRGFAPTTSLRCRFGSSSASDTQAVVMNASVLRCVPPVHAAGRVTLSLVDAGGMVVSRSGNSIFGFYDQPSNVTVAPAFGSPNGGTALHFAGMLHTPHILDNTTSLRMFCYFGPMNVVEEAAELTDSTATCLTPAMQSTLSVLPVLLLIATSSTQARLLARGSMPHSSFSYITTPIAARVLPRNVRSGDSQSAIRITGSEFRQLSSLHCLFAVEHVNITVKGRWISSVAIECMVPSVLEAGDVFVSVANVATSTSFEQYSNALALTVTAPMQLTSLTPSIGLPDVATHVVVRGLNFFDSELLSCSFRNNTIVVIATWINSSALSCLAPLYDHHLNDVTTTTTVRVSNNRVEWTDASLIFEYVRLPRLTSIAPGFGSIRGGTRLSVRGEQFLSGATLYCFFGTQLRSTAQYISSTLVRCLTPLTASAGPLKVTVGPSSATESLFTVDGAWLKYTYTPPVRVLAVSPDAGPARGGTIITMMGMNFVNSNLLTCRFSTGSGDSRQNFTSVAQFLSTTLSQCVAPPLEQLIGAGAQFTDVLAVIELSSNAQDFTSDGNTFKFSAVPRVLSVTPSRGSVFGGTIVTVRGSHLGTTSTLCRFGDSSRSSPAVIVSAEEIQCVTPASRSATRVTLEISVDSGSTYVRSNVGFNFVGKQTTMLSQNTSTTMMLKPHIISITPPSASCGGGADIVVAGRDFINVASLACRFGRSIVRAVFFSRTEIRCKAPRHVPSRTSFEVTVDGTHFSTSNSAFVFDRQPEVHAVSPSIGSARGGTILTVLGTHFVKKSNVACRIGGVITPAFAHVSVNEVHCRTPPAAMVPLYTSVEISTNNFTGTSSPDGGMYVYLPVPRVVTIVPRSGSIIGGTEVVAQISTVTTPSGTWGCRFGGSATVPALLRDETHISCNSPPASTIGRMAFEITFNGQEFSFSGLTYEYTHVLSAISVSPVLVPAFAAGTVIEIRGAGMENTGQSACRFGNTITSATWVSKTMMKCRVTPGAPGTISVDVSSNGIDFTNSKLRLLRYADESVTHVIPPQALWTGLVSVFVRGRNFINTTSLACRFGDDIVRAVWISSRVVTCIVPSRVGRWRNEPRTAVFVDVSNNGVDFTESRTRFEYLHACPRRSFCPAHTIQPCANGTKCSRAGSFNFTLCPVGSFQPRSAQTNCVTCPIGYFCPDAGLSHPVLCPAGYVCDSTGLVTPIKVCPAGHACKRGTKTTDPLDFERLDDAATTHSSLDGYGAWDYGVPENSATVIPMPWHNSTSDWSLDNRSGQLHLVASRTSMVFNRSTWLLHGSQRDGDASGGSRPDHPPTISTSLAERPLPCPVGYFCGEGVSSETPQSKNFSTPQKCFRGHFCSAGSRTPEGKGPCPTGWYCPTDTEAIPCPIGHHCPGVGNYEAKKCYPGTYAAVRMQGNCTLCPPGHICPHWQMAEPRICPAGFICASRGTPLPTIECPAGHYCRAGTFILEPTTSRSAVENARASLLSELVSGPLAPTYSYVELATTPLLPLKCPSGTFCLGGVAHNISMGWLPFNETKSTTDAEFHLYGEFFDTKAHTGLEKWESGLTGHPTLGRRAPQICTEGTYCRAGTPLAGGYDASASDFIGSGRCFPGHYCPPGSEWPTEAPLGNFVPSAGQMTPTLCFAGTYAPLKSTVTCRICPAGHECAGFGTYTPSICPAGTYRSREDSISCRACPEGTWSPYKGNTDVSMCTPCPSGRICTIQSMNNITQSFDCPSGHVCGDATDAVRAFDHACPAGYFCYAGSRSGQVYDHPCPIGHYCLRGTKAYVKTRNKCPIGSYCPIGATRPGGDDIKCPTRTTSVLGVGTVKECMIESINICDKNADRSYLLRGFSYIAANGEERTNGDGETEIVRKVMPINFDDSDPVWFNDTVEVLTACPAEIGWNETGGGSAFSVTVIGQNFRDTKTLRCEWSTTNFERTVPAVFQSRSRVLCEIPPMTLEANLTSMRMRVRVANVDRMSERWAMVDFLNQHETVESMRSKAVQCAAHQITYEGKREGETGIFALRALSQAHISIDLTIVPDEMVYMNDYVLAIYVTPSSCVEYGCDANRQETSFEVASCKRPIPFTPWFEHSSTTKNDILNFTLTALEDIRFRVEVQIINGLYVTAAPLFVRRATVRLLSPKRSKVTLGEANVPMRDYDKGFMTESMQVSEDYQFLTYYNRKLLESTTIAPLNLPPRWNRQHNGVNLERGRVLIAFNASKEHYHVHDEFRDIESGPSYWLNPLDTFDKEKYRETFDEQFVDDDGLNQWQEGSVAAFALPYLPFFSNCNGYDSYMQLWALMESATCSLPPATEFEADAIIEQLIVSDHLYPPEWWRRSFPALPDQDDMEIVRPSSVIDELWDVLHNPTKITKSQPFAHTRRPKLEPLVDHCYHEMYCHYEEDLPNEGVTMRWMEAKTGTHLFYIYKNALSYEQFRSGAETMKAFYEDDEDSLIPVVVNRDAADEEMPEATECTLGCFPREVTLTLQYYQKNVREKTLVRAEVSYSNFDFNTNDTSYKFNFELQPLSFFYLIKFFAIEWEVYIGLFTLIGIFSVGVTVVVYLFNKILCRRSTAFFRFLPYLRVSVPSIVNGFILGAAPTLWSLLLVDLVLWGNFCTQIQSLVLWLADQSGQTASTKEQLTIAYWLFDIIPVSYEKLWEREEINVAIANAEIAEFDENNILTVRLQRMGLGFLVLAMYHMYQGVHIFLPKRVSKRETELMLSRDKMAAKEEVWHPTVWKRSNMLFSSIAIAILSMFIVELSYWESYFDYFYYFMFFFKVVTFFVELRIEMQLKETLLTVPLACAFSIVLELVMFGASDFIDFLMGYLLGYSMAIFERIYFGPYFGIVVEFLTSILTKMIVYTRKMFRIKRRTAIEVEMLIEEKSEEARTNRDVPDVAEGDNSTVEPILDYYNGYAMETLALIYQPFIILILIWFREPIKIIENYGIRKADMYIFLLFATIIVPFQLVADTFLHNVQELVHGWKLYDYLVYTRYRFLQRETRWKGMEDSLDECIDEGMRTLDQMCFSSQFYMMVTIHCTGIVLLIFAIEIMVQHNYNMFADPLLLIIPPILLLMLHASKKLVVWVAMKCNMWQLKHANTAWHSTIVVDDEELGLPKWEELGNLRGASHEQYMMNQRIASETFRHKFVDYNRAWLVDQLPKILTPRTLRRSKPFLVAQFAKILGSVRSDISSDEDSDEEGPVFGPVVASSSTFAIAKMWHARAKWRRRLRETVQPIIERSRRPQCEICLSAKQLIVDLVIPIEVLGDRFLDDQMAKGGNTTGPLDKVAWKNFFQQHEKFHTYCQPCLAQKKEEKRQIASKKFAGDYVSDSDEDEEATRRQELQRRFGDVHLSAASTALLQLWTDKARARLLRIARQGGRHRNRRIAATISDDDSDDDNLGFVWARRPLHLSPASKALALRWLYAVRDRINRGESGSTHKKRRKGKKGTLSGRRRRGRKK